MHTHTAFVIHWHLTGLRCPWPALHCVKEWCRSLFRESTQWPPDSWPPGPSPWSPDYWVWVTSHTIRWLLSPLLRDNFFSSSSGLSSSPSPVAGQQNIRYTIQKTWLETKITTSYRIQIHLLAKEKMDYTGDNKKRFIQVMQAIVI